MLSAILLLALTVGDDKEADEAIERYKAAIKGAAAAGRASAVTELSKTPHEKTLTRLAGVLNGEEMPVRIAAAKGIGNYTDYKKKASGILTGALAGCTKDTADLAAAILEGLGKLGDESALGTIHSRFDDKDAKIAKAALAAAGEIKKSSSIDAIIELMKKYEKATGVDAKGKKKNTNDGGGSVGVPYAGGGGDDPQVKLAQEVLPATIKALTAITKEKWTTSQEWIIWWGRHKNDANK